MRDHAAAYMPLMVLMAISGCTGFPPPPPEAGPASAASFVGTVYASGADSLRYRLYLPAAAGEARPLPLMVMLHGCTQDADDFARGTGMNAVAEEHGFLVAYPEQTAALHPQKCWHWYDPAHQARDRGEPALIAGITREVVRRYPVDATRVYVAGVSAGGAMAVILGATYPDLFAAVASHSGTAYGAAGSVAEALGAMQRGGAAPEAQGAAAFAAMGAHARPLPLMVFHGGRDEVVHPINAEQTAAQWRRANELAGVVLGDAEISHGGDVSVQPTVHRDRQGRVWIESWLIPDLGHAWSGGSPEGSYTDPVGPDATRKIVRFLLRHIREDR